MLKDGFAKAFQAADRHEKKTGVILSAVLVLSLALTGCGNAGKNELSDDMNRANDNISSGSDGSGVSSGNDLEGIPENISYELKSPSGDNTVEVEAEVVSAGYDKIGVYSADRIEVDEDYLKDLADKLFDDGEYEVVKPYPACTMEELEAEETYLRGILAEAESDWSSMLGALAFEMSVYAPAAAEDWHGGEVIWTHTGNGRKEAKLRGEIDGIVYELEFAEREGSGEDAGNFSLMVVPLWRNSTTYSLSDPEYSLSETLYGENQCNKEDAIRYADDLVQRLGFSDMELADFSNAMVYNEDIEDLHLDGYRLYFVRNIGGMQNILCENSYTIVESALDEPFGGGSQEYLVMDIDSQGLIAIGFAPRYELTPMSGQVEKLSFEQVDEVAQNFMQNIINSWDEVKGKYTQQIAEVRLGYVTVLYEDKYVLAPVWVYINAHAFSDQPVENAWFGINALDGSIITMEYDSETGGIHQLMY